MCHGSPQASLFGLMMTLGMSVFMLYHLWSYDRFACLKFSKNNLLKTTILWGMMLGSICLDIWLAEEVFIKYTVKYHPIPGHGVIPAPYQLWSDEYKRVVKWGFYLLCLGWWILMIVHMEEFLFWNYLMSKVRRRGATRTWIKSSYFKFWCLGIITVGGILFGSASIETEFLTQMEANIYTAGSVVALGLGMLSIRTMQKFPAFILDCRRQGANLEVIEKLAYFQHLNAVRTVFRVTYAIALLVLSVDGQTEKKRINNTPAALDGLFMVALFSIFITNVCSVLVLLPRNLPKEVGMQEENVIMAGGHHGLEIRSPVYDNKGSYTDSQTALNPMPKASGNPWDQLGGRLALGRDDIDDLAAIGAADATGDAYELEGGPVRREDPEHRVLAKFQSPLDIDVLNTAPQLRVMMSSSVQRLA